MTLDLHHVEPAPFAPQKGVVSKYFDSDTMVLDVPNHKIDKPHKFSITLFKDKNTQTDFIIQILSTIFHKSRKEIIDILFQIHEKGSGICGVYTKEIAETKISVIRKLAELRQSSLKCKMQKE